MRDFKIEEAKSVLEENVDQESTIPVSHHAFARKLPSIPGLPIPAKHDETLLCLYLFDVRTLHAVPYRQAKLPRKEGCISRAEHF